MLCERGLLAHWMTTLTVMGWENGCLRFAVIFRVCLLILERIYVINVFIFRVNLTTR